MKSILLFCALLLLIFSSKLGLAAGSDGCPGGLERNEDGSCGGGTEPTTPNLDSDSETIKESGETNGGKSRKQICLPGFIYDGSGCVEASSSTAVPSSTTTSSSTATVTSLPPSTESSTTQVVSEPTQSLLQGAREVTTNSTTSRNPPTPITLTPQEAAWLEGVMKMGKFVEDNVTFYVCQDMNVLTTTTPKPTFASTFPTKKTTGSTGTTPSTTGSSVSTEGSSTFSSSSSATTPTSASSSSTSSSSSTVSASSMGSTSSGTSSSNPASSSPTSASSSSSTTASTASTPSTTASSVSSTVPSSSTTSSSSPASSSSSTSDFYSTSSSTSSSTTGSTAPTLSTTRSAVLSTGSSTSSSSTSGSSSALSSKTTSTTGSTGSSMSTTGSTVSSTVPSASPTSVSSPTSSSTSSSTSASTTGSTVSSTGSSTSASSILSQASSSSTSGSSLALSSTTTSTTRSASPSTTESSSTSSQSTSSEPTTSPTQSTKSIAMKTLLESTTTSLHSTSSEASSPSTSSSIGTSTSSTSQPSSSPATTESNMATIPQTVSSPTSSSLSSSMRTTITSTGSTGSLPMSSLESTQTRVSTGFPTDEPSKTTESPVSQTSSSPGLDMASTSSSFVPKGTTSVLSGSPKTSSVTFGSTSEATDVTESTESTTASSEVPSESSLFSSVSDLQMIETSSDPSTTTKSSSESLEASSVDSLLVSSDGTSTTSQSSSSTTEGATQASSQSTETSTDTISERSSVHSSTPGQSATVILDETTSSMIDRLSSSTETMKFAPIDPTELSTVRSTSSEVSGSSDSSPIGASSTLSKTTSRTATTLTSKVTIEGSTASLENSSAATSEILESQSTTGSLEASETSSDTSTSQEPGETSSTSIYGPTLQSTTTGTEAKTPITRVSPNESSGKTTETERGTTKLESSTATTSQSTTSSTASQSSEAPSTSISTMSSSPSFTEADTTMLTSSDPPTKSETTNEAKPTEPVKQRSETTMEPTVDTKSSSSTEQSSTERTLAPTINDVRSSTSTPPSSTKSTSLSPMQTTTSIAMESSSATPTISTPSTTTDPACSRQCPDGYLIGSSSCFLLMPASSKLNSYQSALSYCKTTVLQTLASLDKIKSNADIKLIQEKAALLGVDWIFANGIGGQQERFRKSASVYSIFSQSLTSSPIIKTVGISDVFGNVSALCVLPQYCNKNECDVQKLFLAYDFFSSFNTSTGTLEPQSKGSVTCLYGNKKTTTVTCNTLGTIYPNPTIIDCQEGLTERPLKDTTNETVSSCKVCFGRGTKECQSVLNDNGEVEGYRCVCREPYYMSRCWKTVNPCSSTACGPNGVCHNEIGEMKCTCNWGYSGDKCEKNLKDEFFKKATYSTASGATITFGELIMKVLKSCILGLSLAGNQGNDIQDTHQYFRTFCTVAAGVILTMWSNPTVWGINQAACRYYFILIHFFYMLAMIQWILEAINVNQVLRAVHSNTWEVDNRRNRSWGVRVIVRLAMPTVALAVFLLIVFQTGWFKLAASWTCVGVICQDNLSVWIPVFFFVIIMTLHAAAVYETSLKIQRGRPLIRYLIDFMVERQLTPVEGQRVNKCRDNAFLSFVGLLLLINQWIAVILSSDYRDSKIFGVFAVLSSGAYSLFCSYQDIWTNPEERGNYLQLMQRFFPRQFAPDYNPETTWTFDEVRAHFALPKAQRDEIYESFLSRNQQLQCHHRWDIRLNEILAEDQEITVNLALCKVFCEEMNRLKARRGTNKQKEVIKEVYAAYMHSVPHVNPREAGRLRGRLELVTLAAEDDTYPGGVRMARFFIVPRFHIFEPEIPERGDSTANLRNRNHQRRLLQQLEADIYELAREEALSQRTFMNSAIQFMNYGNKVIR